MHELSIAQALVELAREHVPPRAIVRSIKLKVGPMRGIEPTALHWAWQSAIAGTVLDGSVLDLDMLQWTLTCPKCQRQWTSADLFAVCHCGYDRPNPSGGDELQLVALTVDDPAPDSSNPEP